MTQYAFNNNQFNWRKYSFKVLQSPEKDLLKQQDVQLGTRRSKLKIVKRKSKKKIEKKFQADTFGTKASSFIAVQRRSFENLLARISSIPSTVTNRIKSMVVGSNKAYLRATAIFDIPERLVQAENTIKELKIQLDDLKSKPVKAVRIPENQVREKEVAATTNPAVLKYSKMLSFGIPKNAVIQAMRKDKTDPLLLFPDSKSPQSKLVSGAIETTNKSRSGICLADIKAVSLLKVPLSNSTPSKSGGVSLEELQRIKLRKRPASNINSENPNTPSMKDIVGVKLRKTVTEKSPGGTPFKLRGSSNNRSPSCARSDGEFLHLALKKKFSSFASPVGNVSSPMLSPF